MATIARPGGQVWAVIVAGGSGSRFGAYKQFAMLAGREVVEWSLMTAAQVCDGTVLVVPADLVAHYQGRADRVVAGGATRPASVRAGLAALPAEAVKVAVHDAARPLASRGLWHAVVAAVGADALSGNLHGERRPERPSERPQAQGGLRRGTAESPDGAVPCVPITDTVKQRLGDGRLGTLDRSSLLAAQTPQAFLVASVMAAHGSGDEATDDAALVEADGGYVVEVVGERENLKITGPADLEVAELLLERLGMDRRQERVGVEDRRERLEMEGRPAAGAVPQ